MDASEYSRRTVKKASVIGLEECQIVQPCEGAFQVMFCFVLLSGNDRRLRRVFIPASFSMLFSEGCVC
jgi:hypothetical protein